MLLELMYLRKKWVEAVDSSDGKKVYAKAIYKDPESYFTPEVMEKLDAIAQQHFAYGEN